MDIQNVGWGGIDWIGSWQELAGSSEYGNEPSRAMKCGKPISSQEGLCSMKLVMALGSLHISAPENRLCCPNMCTDRRISYAEALSLQDLVQ
jgi:hypothetical protein